MVDKVTLMQGFSEHFGYPCQFSFHRLLHTHHLSSGAGTADVPSGLSPTPPQETKKKWQFLQTCIITFKNKYNFWVFYRWINVLSFLLFLNKYTTVIVFKCISISTTFIVKLSIYLCSLSFLFCLLWLPFASLIRMTSPPSSYSGLLWSRAQALLWNAR
jgi:hypothetical protein